MAILQSKTNSNLYPISNGAISNGLEKAPNLDYKVSPVFDADYVSNGTR